MRGSDVGSAEAWQAVVLNAEVAECDGQEVGSAEGSQAVVINVYVHFRSLRSLRWPESLIMGR